MGEPNSMTRERERPKHITREVLRAYIIVAVNEEPYITRKVIEERLGEKLKTSLRGLRVTKEIVKKVLGRTFKVLERRGILVQNPNRTWRIDTNFPSIRRNIVKSNERMKLYRLGLSDREIARRQGVVPRSIHQWRNLRGLDANYSTGGSWRGRPGERERMLGKLGD